MSPDEFASDAPEYPTGASGRYEGEGDALTARREFRRGRAYWYAYRRRDPVSERSTGHAGHG